MRNYNESQAYDEVRSNFIEEYEARLKKRGKGERMELISEGTPFESFIHKDSSTLICPCISMALVYRNCFIFALREIDEAVSDVLKLQNKAKRIPQEQMEQIDNIRIFPVNLANHRDRLEENRIAYMPYQDMALTFQFYLEKGKWSYCMDVTKDWLDRHEISAEELFETVRYKDLEQVEIDNLTEQIVKAYGINGFGAVFYPNVMEQVMKRLGNEVLIIPDDAYSAYIQTPDTKSAVQLQEELQADNKVKVRTGDQRLVLSGQVFRYDAVMKRPVPAVEPKVEKHKVR